MIYYSTGIEVPVEFALAWVDKACTIVGDSIHLFHGFYLAAYRSDTRLIFLVIDE